MANRYTAMKTPDRELLIKLYHDNFMSQKEVGIYFNTTQKVVFSWFEKLKIESRKPYKRNQKGENNSSWKKGKVTYSAYHYRVVSARGKANKCEICGEDKKRIEWANMSGNYENVLDYKMMCVSCHHKNDGHRNNLPNRKLPPNKNKRKIIDGK